MEALVMSGPGVYGTYVRCSYEPEVTATLRQLVRSGWICVDLGAHYGYFTLLLAQLVGNAGRVVAFEPSAENAAILQHNIALNGLENLVTVEGYAVSDGSSTEVTLTLPTTFTSEWTLRRQQGAKTQVVPATALDDYFAPGQQVDLIKMDIEGAEAQALSGMRRVLQQAHPTVLMELHGAEGRRAAETLERLGYALLDLERHATYTTRSDSPLPHHVIGRLE
jgi:FkbM family methyltransferase